MAIDPSATYPASQIDVDINYPYGKARNIITPGDELGTPYDKKWLNDVWGLQQALLNKTGLTPSGNPDTADDSQYLKAIHKLNRYFTYAEGGLFALPSSVPTIPFISMQHAVDRYTRFNVRISTQLLATAFNTNISLRMVVKKNSTVLNDISVSLPIKKNQTKEPFYLFGIYDTSVPDVPGGGANIFRDDNKLIEFESGDSLGVDIFAWSAASGESILTPIITICEI